MVRQDDIKIDEAVLEQALSWHHRVESDTADEATWLAYTEWLEADDMHQLAADHVEMSLNFVDANAKAITHELGEDEKVSESGMDNGESSTPDSIVIHAASRFRKPSTWAAVTAVAASFIFAFLNLTSLSNPEEFVEAYQTGPGQRQTVLLHDGSNIFLNTKSKLTVTLARTERRVEMDYGEVLFEVARDESRPFIVSVGGKDVRVVGTRFNIRRFNQKLTVTVTEGVVDVSEGDIATDGPASSDEQPTRLTAGIQFVHDEQLATSIVQQVDAEAMTSWRDGVQAYDDAPLAEVLADIERYIARPIKLEGSLSAIRFSGILNMADPMASLDLLVDTLPIEMVITPAQIIVRACSSCQ